MVRRFTWLFLILFVAASAGTIAAHAQSADNRSPITGKPGDDDENRPKSFKETLERLRIEREKKDFDEMLARGQAALKISEDLERAYETTGRLSERDMTQLAAVEKLVKKIRSELGGDDDDEKDADKLQVDQPIASGEAIKSFRATTLRLFDELKKTSRFTISTAAIQTSNAVIKLARFLRIAK